MKAKNLVDLMFSPVFISTLIHHFLSGAQQYSPQGIKTELLYILIPFIIDDVTRSHLCSANSRSTVASLFYKNDELSTKNSLLIKNKQVNQYREVSNRGLIYLGNIEKLNFDKYITIAKLIDYQKEQGVKRDFCKAAYYLGFILVKEDYKNLFVRLGITNI